MTGYLLDTNVALLALASADAIPAATRRRIEARPRVMSVISYWEVLLKSMKGKLDVGDPRHWWREALERLAATPLPLRPEHVSAIHELPGIHQDPFDRALIAQAQTETLVLVTTDVAIVKYAVESLRVVV